MEWYLIQTGTESWVRKLGTKSWQAHTTREQVVRKVYLWRNDDWIGFEYQGWEIKVCRRLVRCVNPDHLDDLQRYKGCRL